MIVILVLYLFLYSVKKESKILWVYVYIQGPPIVRQSPLLPLISIFLKKVFNETYNRSRRAFSKISFNYTGCFAEGGRHQSNFF